MECVPHRHNMSGIGSPAQTSASTVTRRVGHAVLQVMETLPNFSWRRS
jgi:hypothetical protein